MEQEIRSIFKSHRLGHIMKIKHTDLKWAHGDIYHVNCILVQYTVTEENGHVRSIKDFKNNKIYYKRDSQ